MRATPAAVLEAWLGERSARPPDESQIRRWFAADPALDAAIRARFGQTVEIALAGGLESWEREPVARVASIVVFDQLTRNVFRDRARAFAGDPRALGLARGLRPDDRDRLHPVEHSFALLPWMHSAALADQRVGEATFDRAARRVAPAFRSFFAQGLDFARRHREVIERFGRFPHRNEVLGRVSTPEECAFLERFGAGF